MKVLKDIKLQYVLKGILIGLSTGTVVSTFRLIIESLLKHTINIYNYIRGNWGLIILWVLTSLIIAFFIGRLVKSEPNIRGSGIPQVEGLLIGKIEYNWWTVFWKKYVGGIFSIGSGLFLGREGPSIQLGSTIGQGFNKFFKGDEREHRILISSGASAGLAAAFNAPIAGLLFILEEVHHNFSPLVGLTSFSSAVSANFISQNFFGSKPVLNIGDINVLPLTSYKFLIVLGIVLGLAGYMYNYVLLSLPRIYGKLTWLPSHYYGVVPLLLVIPIGLFAPKLLGGGSNIILWTTDSTHATTIIIGLFIVRFVFSMVSYGSNLPGGIFLPILSLGAIIGSLYGNVLIDIVGISPEFAKNIVIISMAGYFTAISKAPLTAILLVTEMVGNLSQLMPLALVSLVSYLVVDIMGSEPIYEALLNQQISNDDACLLNKVDYIEIPVYAESLLNNCKIKDVEWPEKTLLISIRRGSVEIIPHGDTVIHAGDCLVILTDKGVSNEIKNEIMKLNFNY